jgi:hypothetical protein
MTNRTSTAGQNRQEILNLSESWSFTTISDTSVSAAETTEPRTAAPPRCWYFRATVPAAATNLSRRSGKRRWKPTLAPTGGARTASSRENGCDAGERSNRAYKGDNWVSLIEIRAGLHRQFRARSARDAVAAVESNLVKGFRSQQWLLMEK